MDLAKLLAIFEDEALYFARADLLGDPYEYAIPYKEVVGWQIDSDKQKEELISRLDDALSPDERRLEIERILQHQQNNDQTVIELANSFKKALYVSCWHLNNSESAAMWKLYLKSDEGIAIKSTVGRLKAAVKKFKPEVWIGPIQYIDYETEESTAKGIFDYILFKRNSFSHEQELRAVTWDQQHADDDAPEGVRVTTDISALIADIYVAPSKQEWFLNLVKALVKCYNINAEVIKSSLMDNPAWLK